MIVKVLTSSRADYGIYLPLLKKLKQDQFFTLQIIAFGTHLSKNHGFTSDQIKKDGFEVYHEIETTPLNDSPLDIATAVGETIKKFATFWNSQKDKTDLIICLGDRYEMFGAVAASLPFNIRVAHFHGGETSLGAIDEAFRHSITAMAQLHFTSTEQSAKRVEAIKGSPEGIYNIGAMSLDNLNELQLLTEKEFEKAFGVLPKNPILVTFHPETVAFDKNELYTNEILKVLTQLEDQIFITLPNSDTNGNVIRKAFLELSRSRKNVHCFESLGTQGYFSAIAFSSFLLGNTSSGIIEAASFNKYVINLGDRQKGREHGENVIDCEIKAEYILDIITYLKTLSTGAFKNPYGDGHSSDKVLSLLKMTP
ncbi:MAG TPA: UDP-N-acetylglucosamine 2-epimerase [Bacteroidia bacterium]|jgi:GDP/UDP-N,N'-diacetylbacillosamine 2-epimerase (hydrolysing)